MQARVPQLDEEVLQPPPDDTTGCRAVTNVAYALVEVVALVAALAVSVASAVVRAVVDPRLLPQRLLLVLVAVAVAGFVVADSVVLVVLLPLAGLSSATLSERPHRTSTR